MTRTKARVLVLAEERVTRDLVNAVIRSSGLLCHIDNGESQLSHLKSFEEVIFDLAVVDVGEPPDGQVELIGSLSERGTARIVALVPCCSLAGPIGRIRGVSVVAKPFSVSELRAVLKDALGGYAVSPTRERGRKSDAGSSGECEGGDKEPAIAADGPERDKAIAAVCQSAGVVWGNSRKTQELIADLTKLAASEGTVLLRGESGVGKEFFAHLIHRMSRRASGPFVPVHCGAITPTLVESELFGHSKSAFTGALVDRPGLVEAAKGGTLFLDEIGEMSTELQIKFHRLLENREYRPVGSDDIRSADCRIISATNAPLEEMIDQGRFRKDLYYRLNVLTVRIAPLRERPEDIPILLERFLSEFARRDRKQAPQLTEPAMAIITRHVWNGNVRELRNFAESVVVRGARCVVDVGDLPLSVRIQTTMNDAPLAVPKPRRAPVTKEQVETALFSSEWDVSAAARSLGIARQYCHALMNKFRIQRSR
jgi:DNA-binding NtrC family response regulator